MALFDLSVAPRPRVDIYVFNGEMHSEISGKCGAILDPEVDRYQFILIG